MQSRAAQLTPYPTSCVSIGSARELFWREASVGVNRASYYVGKVLADAPKLVLLAFFFVAPLVAIAPYRSPVEFLYLAILTNMSFVFAMGYAISAAIPVQDNANLTAVVLAVIMNCEGGEKRDKPALRTPSDLPSLPRTYAVFSGFVGLLGQNGGWAYTHWVQRSYIAIELMEGIGMSSNEFDSNVYSEEFKRGNWRMVRVPMGKGQRQSTLPSY